MAVVAVVVFSQLSPIWQQPVIPIFVFFRSLLTPDFQFSLSVNISIIFVLLTLIRQNFMTVGVENHWDSMASKSL